jgi:starch synthase
MALHILMAAAENDALPGGKVGGVGDVVRDAPQAVASLPGFDGSVSVVCPSYGFLHETARQSLGTFSVRFAGRQETVDLYEVRSFVPGTRVLESEVGSASTSRVRQLVIHHPRFEAVDARGRKRIYVDDPPKEPFASDASRFALFSAAVVEGLLQQKFGPVNRLHLHDWHLGCALMLREFDRRYAALRDLRTVFTIHNLALQGVRPLDGYESSLMAWFPDSGIPFNAVRDPQWTDCVNPMAAAIRLADAVHVVSPGYADEVCLPSRPKRCDEHCTFFGGEGLEEDLQRARAEQRLHGILNGCAYESGRQLLPRTQDSWHQMLDILIAELQSWRQVNPTAGHELGLQRLGQWRESPRPRVVMTSVTRAVDQKVRLMKHPTDASPLDRILSATAGQAVFILAGSGDTRYEEFLSSVSRRHNNFVFVNGYSVVGADALYECGDLFLMPSAFEPCGISQMLAMRAGQPCVVHAIGGLKDTVQDNATGFCFTGDTPEELGDGFVTATLRATALKCEQPWDYAAIQQRAFDQTFNWSNSVREYVDRLYC